MTDSIAIEAVFWAPEYPSTRMGEDCSRVCIRGMSKPSLETRVSLSHHEKRHSGC